MRISNFELTKIGSQQSSRYADSWYSIAFLIHRDIEPDFALEPWWTEREKLPSLLRLTEFFQYLAERLPGSAAIFLDEIETAARLKFSADFFAAIRAFYNGRAQDPRLKKITFALAGVATPSQLIADPRRTPFNIARAIELADFTLEQAMPLARWLHSDRIRQRSLLAHVFKWTGGHPYLTQSLCRDTSGGSVTKGQIDAAVQRLFLSPRAQREETNLSDTGDRLKKARAEVLQIYSSIRGGRVVADQPGDRVAWSSSLPARSKLDEGGLLPYATKSTSGYSLRIG